MKGPSAFRRPSSIVVTVGQLILTALFFRWTVDDGRSTAFAEEDPAAPIAVRFEVQDEKVKPGVPISLTLVVERGSAVGPLWKGEAQLELLLRLPSGVKLVSLEDWRWELLPKEEQEDMSGPWRLYKRQQPVEVQFQRVTGGASVTRDIAKIPLPLAVMEEGTNWVITARARIVEEGETWQGFGVIFATLQNGIVEFHTAPKNA